MKKLLLDRHALHSIEGDGERVARQDPAIDSELTVANHKRVPPPLQCGDSKEQRSDHKGGKYQDHHGRRTRDNKTGGEQNLEDADLANGAGSEKDDR